MLLGVLPPYRSGVVADPTWMTEFANLVERIGFESLYLVEHVGVAADYAQAYPYSESGRMPLPVDCPIPDPLELTAFLAARTDRLRFGTGVLVAPHHHPLMLAKRLSTLSVLSGGRISAGFGVGWMREEVEATGSDYSRRGAQTTEMLRVLRACLDDDPAGARGEFYNFGPMHVWPRPVEPIPLHVGGHSAAAARRAGSVADGFHPLGLDPETLKDRWEIVRRSAEEAGRDPDALELSVTLGVDGVTPEAVSRYAELGVHRIVVSTAATSFEQIEPGLAAAVEAVS
jgi:probable F420-dependent oxidoreductase